MKSTILVFLSIVLLVNLAACACQATTPGTQATLPTAVSTTWISPTHSNNDCTAADNRTHTVTSFYGGDTHQD